MRLKHLFLFIFSFFTLLLGSIILPKQSFASSFQLSGSVNDNSAAPIVGATVDVFSPGTKTDVVTPVTTDSSGNYIFSSIPQGTYDVQVTPPSGDGFNSAAALSYNITSNSVLNFILTSIGTVTMSGHILDASGAPLANQKVFINTSTATNNPIASTTTDSTGYYSLQASPGTYYLFLQSPPTGNSLSASVPAGYQIIVENFPFTQDYTSLDITIPAQKVVVHVQDSSNTAIAGTSFNTSPLNLVGGHTISIGSNTYSVLQVNSYGNGGQSPITDASGNATMWLLPQTYSIAAVPPSGSIYQTFILNNVIVSLGQNQTELISLQYIHATPVTTASLVTQNTNGTYSDPTTVTLSATAASGYTIANTYYTIDGGSQQIYSSPVTVSGSGSHTITYWSIDNSGVPETPNSKTFTIFTNQAPIISPISGATINEGDTFTASGSFTDSDSTSWTGTVDYGDGGGFQPLTLNPDKTFTLSNVYKDNGSFVIKVAITDNQGATATENIPITVNNVSPTVNSISVSPTNPQVNQPITATATFTDPGVLDTHITNIDWGDNSSFQCSPNTTDCTLNETNGSGSFTGTHTYTNYGTYTITLKVTDKDGGFDTKTTQIFVNSSPTANAGGPYSIAEGGSMPLSGSGSDPDGDSLTYAWDLSAGGTNFTTPGQNPIFYATNIDAPKTQTVNLQVCDNHGACSTSLATVNIFDPNPIVNPISVNTTLLTVNSSISTSTTFTDAINDTDTATWNWGDTNTSSCPPNTTDCTLNETNGEGTVTGFHTYTQTGVYQLSVTVKDENGVSTMQTYPDYIVVYDPSSGFVTGSGTITSPTGAETTDPSAVGSATFGINAKYTNNQNIPTGTTMFSFPNGGFDFTSNSYDWMVVNGTTAYLHGTGTINGSSQTYTFLVSVVDGSPDTFRIKITDSSNTVIYDNQIGSGDNATPTEAIDHGQIKIH